MDKVIVRGGGDVASGTINKLHNCEFKVLVLEKKIPTFIRRTVCYGSAVYNKKIIIEGIEAVLVCKKKDIYLAWQKGKVPVVVDEKGEWIEKIRPIVLVDAILAKKNIGTSKNMAPITIALGPGFKAGLDVDAVIETKRGHDLGRLILKGKACKNTNIPGVIEGYSKERVIHSPQDGNINIIKDIGSIVSKGEIIATIGEKDIKATIDGVLRGMIKQNFKVFKGLKIADIDPRIKEKENCYTISDKARCIAGGVLEAILFLKNRL